MRQIWHMCHRLATLALEPLTGLLSISGAKIMAQKTKLCNVQVPQKATLGVFG